MKNKVSYFDVLKVKNAYLEGGNVTELLRNQIGIKENSPEIIEIAYDLQAGSYIDFINTNYSKATLYINEIANILSPHINNCHTILDVGCGELTTLSLLINSIKIKPKKIYAFDISFSRACKGIQYARKVMQFNLNDFNVFTADIASVPLLNKSIDITISNHALEPNGGRLVELMLELFRVTRKKIILFEPCYEISTMEGKLRMDALGYIKGIDHVVEGLGGKVVDKIIINNPINPLNQTVAFIIVPPDSDELHESNNKDIFSTPGGNYQLIRRDNFYYTPVAGLVYPIILNIPVLKNDNLVLATILCEDVSL